MPPISDLVERRLAQLTPQQIADLALSEDRQMRSALARHDAEAAAAHKVECERLCRLLEE